MVARIIDFCANNRLPVLLGVAFATLASVYCVRHVKLDAIPDLSDPQVIVFSEWMGRSPTLVEDQVTYPIAASLLGTPHVTDVRGYSMFGMSFIYVIFEEGTDQYWARSRVLEYLNGIRGHLPEGVNPVLGPDASAIGWVFQYALVDGSGTHGLDELRAYQDFSLRYALTSVPGVAEVASIGGYQKQYQITIDPNRLRAYGVSLEQLAQAVRQSNDDVGGRVIELSGREYFVRGRGYVKELGDLERIVIKNGGPGSAPVLVRDVASVRFGPEIRRGVLDWNGDGETVGAVVVMRHGENALDVIGRVKRRLKELEPGMPKGVRVEIAYDRSSLIERSIATLKRALLEEMTVVALVIALFLMHFRSSLLPIVSLPIAVGLSFIPMYLFDIPSTIMSLGGIAIAIGATVDAEIVMIEACHKKLEHAPPGADRKQLLAEAAREVTPAIFFSLLIIAVAFLPVFALGGQAGRLFKPLAYTKTFVMLGSALLSITFAPALRDLLIRGRIRPEHEHPLSRLIVALYRPFVYVALRRPISTVAIGALAVLSAVPLASRLGHEFMPPLDEGDVLYMPITLPNISIEEAKRQLQRQDQMLRSFPEVASVFGKVGRVESPTDPAPLTMVETTVRLRSERTWRKVTERRFYSGWAPGWLKPTLRRLWPEQRPIHWEELTAEMNRVMQFPGWTNAWTMPIKTRVDMLSTGIRTPIGIKVLGSDLQAIERIGKQLEHVVATVPGTRSVFYERNLGGLYLDIVPNRDALARYGLRIADVENVIEASIGGVPISTTVEGRNRFSINVRYPRDMRSDVEHLREVLVPLPVAGQPEGTSASTMGSAGPMATRAPGGQAFVPLGQLADVRVTSGPPMVRDEGGSLVGYVYVDIDSAKRDIGGYVIDAKAAVHAALGNGELTLPTGYSLKWTGQYELLEQMRERMKLIIPVTLLLVVLLLYAQFRNVVEVLIVLLSIPFALVGSVWLMWLLDYRISTAVWVGVIALVGLAAQTGVVMIVYIDHALERRRQAGTLRDLGDVIEAHMEGTVQRVRPKLMTVATMLIGLVPLLWATGTGADVMKRIAAPMVGGLLTSAFLTLEIIPVISTYFRYEQLLWHELRKLAPAKLAWLERAATALGLALSVLVLTLVSPVYVTAPAWAVRAALALAALVIAGSIVAYLWQRPSAKRLVWPTSHPA
ncbi:MAG: efflux RND transporter permease subunit [Polyangiales bacterium]